MVHRAGSVVGLVQRCVRCGEVLASYRHVTVEDPRWCRWWPVGASVEMVGGWNQEQIVVSRAPTCEATAAPAADDLRDGAGVALGVSRRRR